METFKIILPVITTLLGAALSFLAIEYRSTKEQSRLLEREAVARRGKAISATAEALLLSVSGQISSASAKIKIIEIYASNFMILEDGFFKKVIKCFDEDEIVIPKNVEAWIKSQK